MRPACLPNIDINLSDEYSISGWEMNEEIKTHVTNYNNIQNISREDCNKFYEKFKGLIRGIDSEIQICISPNDVACKVRIIISSVFSKKYINTSIKEFNK